MENNQNNFTDLPDLPEIATPDPEQYVRVESEVEKDLKPTALSLGFVGVGQAGGKIANEFYRLGYRKVLAINTAANDFMGLDLPKKAQMLLGDGAGAGKNPAKGAKAVADQREDLLSLMRRNFGTSVDKILVLVSGGGGTGSGGCVEMLGVAQEYLKEIGKSPDKNVGVLIALPKNSEVGASQKNAAQVVEAVQALPEISPVILVDNEQISKQWPAAGIGEIYNLANRNVTSLLDIFNVLASRPSQFSSFDRADFCSVLEAGMIVFGSTVLKDVSSGSALADAIRGNLGRGVLVSDVDMSTAKAGAGIVVGGLDVLNSVPSSYLDEAFKALGRVLGSDKKSLTLHQAVYETQRAGMYLYSMAAGVDFPKARLEAMKK